MHFHGVLQEQQSSWSWVMNTDLGSTTSQPTLQGYLWQVGQSSSWQGALTSNTADPDVGDTGSSREGERDPCSSGNGLGIWWRRGRDPCSSGNGSGTWWRRGRWEDDDMAVELCRSTRYMPVMVRTTHWYLQEAPLSHFFFTHMLRYHKGCMQAQNDSFFFRFYLLCFSFCFGFIWFEGKITHGSNILKLVLVPQLQIHESVMPLLFSLIRMAFLPGWLLGWNSALQSRQCSVTRWV